MNMTLPLLACFLCWCAMGAEIDLADFQLDPRLQIKLFASEPDVIDPVALCFDEGGRMYVVEMRDYPYGIGPEKKAGGTVRLLEDTDGDGKADKSTIFARDLSFPTSVAPWAGGIFVSAPPEIIYLKDTDGDGIADIRQVYFSGFVAGVTDSNINGLRWGLDNRIHGVNGGNGGNIKGQLPKNSGVNIPLENADFSFDPQSGDFKTTYQTSGGFGLVFDEFGRSFSTYNINHIQQRILPLYQLNRYPGMIPVEATQSISDHEEMARIFPISLAQTRPNHPEQSGHFSSAGGVGYIGDDRYPGDLYRSLTVGDVVGNLIHRDILQQNGPIFVARRSASELDREFIRSRDIACRMTGLELGPDGALYVIDMQRDVIEHPDYIPEKIRSKIDIRAGDNRGRIYRITPHVALAGERVHLDKATPDELVNELESHNQWRRQTAQRLIIQNNSRTIFARLEGTAAKSKYPPARVHALWALSGLRLLNEYRLAEAFKDPDPGVRLNAVQIAENSRGTESLTKALLRMTSDSSAEVRFQAALSLGAHNGPPVQNALAKLLFADRTNNWMRVAAISSMRSPIDSMKPILDLVGTSAAPVDRDVVRELSDVAVARSDFPASRVTEILNELQSRPAPIVSSALEGVEGGLARNPINQPRLRVEALLAHLAEKSEETFISVWKLCQRLELPYTPRQKEAIGEAIKKAQDQTQPMEIRLASVKLLNFASYKEAASALFANLGATADATLQIEALKVLSRYRDVEVGENLVSHWAGLAPTARPMALQLLLSRRPFHNALVSAMESGSLKTGELNLDLEQRRVLLRKSTPEIQSRAGKLISDEEYSNRKSVVDEWQKKLPPTGDSAKGKIAFERICATCHRVGTVGHLVGPDLTSVSHRSVEDLLFNILDPNMAINPKYINFQIETKDGELVNGIVDQETPQAVTVLQASELRTTILRKDISRMRSTGTSLMPEGLESGLTPADLRDLIAFIQQEK